MTFCTQCMRPTAAMCVTAEKFRGQQKSSPLSCKAFLSSTTTLALAFFLYIKKGYICKCLT